MTLFVELIKILACIALAVVGVDVYLYIGVLVFGEKTMVTKRAGRFGYTLTVLFWPIVILYLLWLQKFIGYWSFVDSIKLEAKRKDDKAACDSDAVEKVNRILETLNDEQRMAVQMLLGMVGIKKE